MLGIQSGDLITAVNKTPVHTESELAQVLVGLPPGQAIPVTVTTPQGAIHTLSITLTQLPGR